MDAGLFVIALTFGIVAVCVFLILRVRRGGIAGTISKAVASFFFVLTCVSASIVSPKYLGIKAMILLGLVLGMLGDIWLDLKWTYPKDIKPWLYSGFISFMLGHLFFIPAIMFQSKMKPLFIMLSILIAIIIGGIATALEKVMKLNYGSYKLIVFLYASVLMCTAVTALFACIQTGFKVSVFIVILIGSVFFAISDLILSGTYFGDKSKNTPTSVILNHVTYYIAQYAIASSVLFLK
ncbi:MAG: lysoplasmalogenase family protein [Candidatus Fimenecus sp.]